MGSTALTHRTSRVQGNDKKMKSTILNVFWRQILFSILAACCTSALHKDALAIDDPIQICGNGPTSAWYFSIGSTVFEIHANELNGLRVHVDDANEKFRLISPDSSAEIGCRDNPQQIQMFTALDWPVPNPTDYSGFEPKKLDILKLYAASKDFILELENDQSSCDFKFHKYFDNGIVYCTDKIEGVKNLNYSNALSGHLLDFGWKFIFPRSVYHTPLAEKFVVSGSPFHGVEAIYALNSTTIIDYNWILPMKAIPVDPQYVIGSDRLVRESISSIEVKDYVWRK